MGIARAVLLVLSLCAVAGGSPADIYERAQKTVVGVRAVAALGERTGAGIILDADGYILTSSSIVPVSAKEVRVWINGATRVRAEIVGSVKEQELTIVKIDPKGLQLHPATLGSSAGVRVGDVAYTIGNAFFSIINDDQPSFSAGIVSGIYSLNEERGDATYVGQVVETTAAINPGMEGGALLDREGKVVGMITSNHSIQRWLGAAIPIDLLRKDIELLKAGRHPSQGGAVRETDRHEQGKGYLGIGVEAREGKIVVVSVDKEGPSWKKGIREGDVIVGIAGNKPSDAADFLRKLADVKAGAVIWLNIDIGGEGVVEELKIVLDKEREMR